MSNLILSLVFSLNLTILLNTYLVENKIERINLQSVSIINININLAFEQLNKSLLDNVDLFPRIFLLEFFQNVTKSTKTWKNSWNHNVRSLYNMDTYIQAQSKVFSRIFSRLYSRLKKIHEIPIFVDNWLNNNE